ncbi:MAG TPA: hypothetical protein ENI05_10690 [Porticoccus sp.]|nr:hypothetical protein [Porticoccus sp.]
MTIPFFDVGWKAVNVQYRLTDPPAGVGKYRFTHGLPTPLFLTNPYDKPAGPTLLVEGAKKAIVCFDNIDDLNIVAIPSKAPPARILESLSECDPIYIALDPDAYVANGGKPAVNRVVAKLGRERCRIVKLPCKADDLFTRHGGTAADMNEFIYQGLPV